MINHLIRYFKGYLRIRISGSAVERFLNTCSYKGIHIWELTTDHSFYELNITISDFKKLKPVIRKTRTKVIIVKRSGFPFFINKYDKRKMFFLGLILFVIIILHLSTYVWTIEIKGNYANSTEALTTYLKSININIGTKVKEVDCTDISRKIRQKYDDIIWVSTHINGTSLVIQIKENQDSKELSADMETKAPYDIISDGDYLITRIIVRNGIPNVKENMNVKQGDLLVSGQIPIYNDAKEITSYQYCISDADIYGKTTVQYEKEMKRMTFQKKYLNIEKQQYFITFGKYRFQFGSKNNNYDSFTEYSKKYSIGGLSFGIRSVFPYKKIEKVYSDIEIQKLLNSDFAYYCQQLEKKGVVILKNNVKIYTWSDKAIATGKLTVEMPIGQKVKSELTEIGDYIDGNDGNNN